MPYCRKCGSFFDDDYLYCEECGTPRKNQTAFTKSVGKTCPYCQFPIKQDNEVFQCPACKVPHHLECWEENGNCTTFGCTGVADNAYFNRNDPNGFGRTPGRITIESESIGSFERDISHGAERSIYRELVSYPRASYIKRLIASVFDMAIVILFFYLLGIIFIFAGKII